MHSQREIRAKEFADLAFRIALNLESATVRGSLRTERGQDKMASRPERLAKNREIVPAILDVREEVKDCSIVPNRKRANGLEFHDVCFKPGDARGKVAQAGPGVQKSARSDVDNADVGVARAEQMIGEG